MLKFTLTQSGNAITGVLEQEASLCVSGSVPVTGAVKGDSVTIHLDTGPTVADFTGTVHGNQMSGTENVTRCSAGAGAADWSVTK